jgi:hypothetical protein
LRAPGVPPDWRLRTSDEREIKETLGMSRRIVTANRLSDGLVIYYTAAGRWSPDIADAAVAADQATAETLLAEAQAGATRHAVNPYLIPIADETARVWPAQIKEVIRAQGPTRRSDLVERAA